MTTILSSGAPPHSGLYLIILLGLGLFTLGALLLVGRRGPRALVLDRGVTLPHGTENSIPGGEEGLGEVGLDAPALVVDVVVSGIVAGDVLQGVPGQRVSAVVVDRLHHAADKEEHALARGHEGALVGDGRTESVEHETLDGVVVEGAVGVGNVETVVTSMPLSCWRESRC